MAAMTATIHLLHAGVSLANVSMLYLLVVTGAALFLGSFPAVVASILSFLALDWFFVEPRYQLTVQDPAEWLALCMFLLTATVTGQLTALLRARAEEAQRSKSETDALAEASWAVASELERDRALSRVLEQVAAVLELESAFILVIEEDGKLNTVARLDTTSPDLDRRDPGPRGDPVQFVIENRRAIGWDGSKLWTKALFQHEHPAAIYLPIMTEDRVVGVLCLNPRGEQEVTTNKRRVIDSLVNHAALTIQRAKLMKVEANAQALAEADRLKTALLSMVSHDFRSPLTSIKASVSGLLQEGAPWDPDMQRALLQGIDEETDRLNRMVGNILDLSRLEAGAWQPRREPTAMADLLSAALDSFDSLDNARIQVDLDRTIADVSVDSVQMVQVLRNLLENALKYSPLDTQVELKVLPANGSMTIEVLDRGPGLPKGEESHVFEAFYRAPELKESSVPGIGIGLALCQGLIEAHGGKLDAYNRDGGGAVFRLTIPTQSATTRETTEAKKHESASDR